MSAVSFYSGIAQLALVLGALGYAALRLRRNLLPGWDEAAGYLVTAVTGVGMLEQLGVACVSGTVVYALPAVNAAERILGQRLPDAWKRFCR